MNGFYDEIVAILKRHGWTLHRQGKGSHEVWAKNGRYAVTVPRSTKSRHTANSILKQAGINEKV